MIISKKEVQHIARLARIGLTEKEAGSFQKELSLILDYIGKLKKADVEGVDPMSHPYDFENVTRKDRGRRSEPKEIGMLMKTVPTKERGHVKVKAVL